MRPIALRLLLASAAVLAASATTTPRDAATEPKVTPVSTSEGQTPPTVPAGSVDPSVGTVGATQDPGASAGPGDGTVEPPTAGQPEGNATTTEGATVPPTCASDCFPGACDQSVQCVEGSCIRTKKAAGVTCTDIEGFRGACSAAGICVVHADPVMKSRDGNLVVHVSNKGDMLFAAADLAEEISMRNMASSLGAAHDAVSSLEARLSAEEADHDNTQQDTSSISTTVSDVEAQLRNEIIPLETNINDLRQVASDHSLELAAQAQDIGGLSEQALAVSDQVVANTVSLADLAANKASKDDLSSAIGNLQTEIDGEQSELRAVQSEIAEKVITVTDQTTDHNSLIAGILTSINVQGSAIDGHADRLQALETSKTDVSQVSDMVKSAVAPLAKSADLNTLADRINDAADFEEEVNTALDDIKQQVSLAIARYEISHLGRVTGRLSASDVTPSARTVCGNSDLWYDVDAVKCTKCDSGMYDRRSGQCLVSPITAWHQGGYFAAAQYCAAEGTTTPAVLGAHKLRVFAPADNTQFWIYHKTLTYQYGTQNCHGDNDAQMFLYPVIDGKRADTYCQYNYIRGWSTPANEYSLHECSFIWTFSAGEHLIDFDVVGRGNQNALYGYPYSSLKAQMLGPVSPSVVDEEKSACVGRTSRTLVSSYLNQDIQLRPTGCAWVYSPTLSQYFANPPGGAGWKIRSASGLVRIHFKAMTYLYGISSGCGFRAWLMIVPVIDGVQKDWAAYNYITGVDRPNNKHDTIDTTHFLRLQKGREYTIDFRMAGHGDAQLILYSNFLRSNLLIEDMPEPNPTPPTSIPTGCAGLVRNIMVVGKLSSQSRIDNAGSMTTRFLDNYGLGPYTIRVNHPQTHIRIRYGNNGAYQYGNTAAYGDRESLHGLAIYINNVDQGWCAHNYERGWSRPWWDRHKPLICEQDFILNPGTYKIQLQQRCQGIHCILYDGEHRDAFEIEQLVGSQEQKNH